MVRFADLSWPHLLPLNHPQNLYSRSPTPSSPSGCVRGIVLQIEEKLQLLSEDDKYSHTPVTRSTSLIAGRLKISSEVERHTSAPVSRGASPFAHKMPYFWNVRQPRVESPALQQKKLVSSEFSESTDSPAPVTVMMSSEAAQGPDSLLPPRSKIHGDHDGTFLTSQTPGTLEVGQAVDLSVDFVFDNEETPLEIAQLQFRDRKSFNSGVRDLLQETPDTPIGGLAMKRSLDPGSLERGHMEVKQDDISTSYFPKITDSEQRRPLNNRTNFSDPVSAVSIRDTRVSLTRSDTSLPILTAPHSPAREKRIDDHSDPSCNRPNGDDPLYTAEVQDSAQVAGPHDLAHCVTNPMDDGSGAPKTAEAPIIMPEELIIDPKTEHESITAPIPTTLANAAAGTNEAVAVPIDITGQLPVPAIPISRKGRKRKRATKKGQKLVRKSRARLIRSPVLVIILGRQLGKSTAFALKEIAADTTTVQRTSTPAPIPVLSSNEE